MTGQHLERKEYFYMNPNLDRFHEGPDLRTVPDLEPPEGTDDDHDERLFGGGKVVCGACGLEVCRCNEHNKKER